MHATIRQVVDPCSWALNSITKQLQELQPQDEQQRRQLLSEGSHRRKTMRVLNKKKTWVSDTDRPPLTVVAALLRQLVDLCARVCYSCDHNWDRPVPWPVFAAAAASQSSPTSASKARQLQRPGAPEVRVSDVEHWLSSAACRLSKVKGSSSSSSSSSLELGSDGLHRGSGESLLSAIQRTPDLQEVELETAELQRVRLPDRITKMITLRDPSFRPASNAHRNNSISANETHTPSEESESIQACALLMVNLLALLSLHALLARDAAESALQMEGSDELSGEAAYEISGFTMSISDARSLLSELTEGE